MIQKLQITVLLLSFFFIGCSLPAISLNETSIETYDKVLRRLEKIKEIQDKDKKEKACFPSKHLELKFEHDKLPDLNGIWIVKKKTIQRKINPVLSKPITFIHCTSRLPFEKRDFKEKEVVISLTSPNSFTVMAIYPVTEDIYYDPNQEKDFVYENFNFKASIRPEDITYAYTIKLKDHIDHPTLARQLWLNGKLKLEHISGSKITAKGYEVEYTPECHGFVIDEVAFAFDKERNISGAGEGTVAMSFLIEQAANAAEGPGIPDENKSMNLESAKDGSGFESSDKYKPEESEINVPGLW